MLVFRNAFAIFEDPTSSAARLDFAQHQAEWNQGRARGAANDENEGKTMKQKKTSALTALAIVSSLALAACGGGGGDSSNASAPVGASTPNTPATAPANLATPQYAANSAQLAMFQLLNQERQQCGFPAVQDNATLDQAAAAHAQYMASNSLVVDDEVQSNAGFTGVTYTDRATHFGYPTSVSTAGASTGFFTNATLTETEYGQQMMLTWLSGVYHIAVGVWPITAVGIGKTAIQFNGFPATFGTITLANLQPMTNSGPLTFPCQGTTGVAYQSSGETPTPPNTTGPWGTPVAVAGNPNDTVVLQSATMTDLSNNNVIVLQMLDSATDPNKLLPSFEAVAYPASPLNPNNSYSVTITGTVNGQTFTRTFTFTTGNVIG